MRRALKWTGIMMGMAVTLFTTGFVVFASLVTADTADAPPKADGIVALTGASDRIDAATILLAQGRGKRLLISGVNRIVSKAALERLTPERAAFYHCCIDIGYVALDTSGNASETRDWVAQRGFDSLIVVTSDYHMPRSLVELARTMPDVELIPYPTHSDALSRQWWTSAGTVKVLMSEYVKLLPAAVRLAVSRALSAPESDDTSIRASSLL